MNERLHHILIAYFLGVLLTYGPAYNLDYHESDHPMLGTVEVNLVPAIGSSLFWPFYWSVKLTQHLRP